MKLSKETQDLIQECKIKNKQYRDSYSIKERNKITRELSELTNNIKDALSKEIPGTLHVTVSKDIDISYYFEEIITGMIEFDLSIEQAIKDAVEYEKNRSN